MKAGLCWLTPVLGVCVAVAVGAVFWLGKNVFETYAMRDAEIRLARVVELTQTWETAVFRDWTECIERLNAISPEAFSGASVRAATEKSRFRFPAHIETGTQKKNRAADGENFFLSCENDFYVLVRETPSHGVQCIVFDKKALFEAVGNTATQILFTKERAKLRLVPVPEKHGFGIVRGLPGAKLEFELEARKHADSVAAKHAVLLAGMCIFFMLAAIVVLVLRVFSLSEKRYLFASAVSHELKTPLAELQTCTNVAIECMGETAAGKELMAIDRCSRELGMIVENLLIFSRMKTGTLRFSSSEYSAEDVFSRIFERIGERLLAADTDVFFDINPDARPRRLRTSVEMLGRILFNLADNAAKYARRECGGENPVTFRLFAEASRLYIDVEDCGYGIPEDVRGRIFKPFVRGNASNGKHGLGLGLAISARSAKLLGGTLSLLKSDSDGSTFRLVLPLSDA